MNDKILVVDDEESLRLSMKFKLTSAGFIVDIAGDGEEALEKLKSQSVDVILLDINMPRMSGIEALTLIRQEHPHTEVIMLTGFADFSTAIECLKMGARDYLVKPVDTTELVTRLKSLLRSRSSEKALYEVQEQYSTLFLHDLLEPLKTIQEQLGKAAKMNAAAQSKERQKLIEEAIEKNSKMASMIQALIDFSLREFEKGKIENGQIIPEEIAKRLQALRTTL